MFSLHHGWLLLLILLLMGWVAAQNNTPEFTSNGGCNPSSNEFCNPQRVTILGYDDHAMEPFLSRDGQYLLFNNSNDHPRVNTNLHWATRLDDLTFQYQGEISGVNTAALDAVPSMDRNSTLYFISTQSYMRNLSTIYSGTFDHGKVSGVALVQGVSILIPRRLNFDAEISADGNTLYFVDGLFVSSSIPQKADILIAQRVGKKFQQLTNAAWIMQNINTPDLEYAPAISASGLEIFFTRLSSTPPIEKNIPAIYVARRTKLDAPFDKPQQLQNITGFVEAATLSSDEKAIYYHKNDEGVFVIYRATQKP